jgi:hypothetical protein
MAIVAASPVTGCFKGRGCTTQDSPHRTVISTPPAADENRTIAWICFHV